MKYRTMKKNGKRRVIPISEKNSYSRARKVSSRELRDDLMVGIRHPGSLTSVGYHIQEPVQKQHAALDKAVKKYGRKETLEKLSDLYRLDYHRPELKAGIVSSIKYVSGGKRND
ncbi:MAG: hypothetical protein RE471_09895 [Ferroplasma sp.]|uniref:hypothetical protein n=1 Tax=Ferroplasma sp. TaxID=2591003 RepID=UPI00281564B2|nr:hypothetical protein [Ferroplasma sp.]WMT51232.1 MAG: hypothetical protein RE471_09675 [Ferroplasma sp.]WMT51275.1 MAG: hypothetical protein RE471_09895 [Ferroplasma sp.]